MTSEDIINLARKANACADGRLWLMYAEDLEIFFNLATAHEREMCAKACEELPLLGPYKDVQTATLEDAAAAIRARGQA